MSEAYLAGITCEAFEVEWESVQTAKKLFEVVPPFFHELFGHCSKTGRRQQRLKVRKSQKIFNRELVSTVLVVCFCVLAFSIFTTFSQNFFVVLIFQKKNHMNDLKDHTDIPTCSKVYQVPMATKILMATKSFNGNKKFQWKLSSNGNKSSNGN